MPYVLDVAREERFQVPLKVLEPKNWSAERMWRQMGSKYEGIRLWEQLQGFEGERVNPDLVWKVAQLDPDHESKVYREPVSDVFTALGETLVNQKVVDLIEELEPSVHQFVPFELVDRDGKPWHELYFMLNICNRVDAVVAEESDLDVPVFLKGNPGWSYDGGGKHWTLRGEAIEGMAIWSDIRLCKENLCSDAFWNAFNDRGLTGLEARTDRPIIKVV